MAAADGVMNGFPTGPECGVAVTCGWCPVRAAGGRRRCRSSVPGRHRSVILNTQIRPDRRRLEIPFGLRTACALPGLFYEQGHRYILMSVLARVMTFYAESARMTDLVESLRSDLPREYEALPGFRGLLVLERGASHNHVIALTLWENEEGIEASEAMANAFANRIAEATGTAVSRHVYDVLGRLGIADRPS